MFRLSEKQTNIVRAIVDKQEGRDKEDTIEIGELGVYLYDVYNMPMPHHWKAALNVTMRELISKLAPYGRGKENAAHLERVSSLGRGREAVYQFRGDFKRLLTKT